MMQEYYEFRQPGLVGDGLHHEATPFQPGPALRQAKSVTLLLYTVSYRSHLQNPRQDPFSNGHETHPHKKHLVRLDCLARPTNAGRCGHLLRSTHFVEHRPLRIYKVPGLLPSRCLRPVVLALMHSFARFSVSGHCRCQVRLQLHVLAQRLGCLTPCCRQAEPSEPGLLLQHEKSVWVVKWARNRVKVYLQV